MVRKPPRDSLLSLSRKVVAYAVAYDCAVNAHDAAHKSLRLRETDASRARYDRAIARKRDAQSKLHKATEALRVYLGILWTAPGHDNALEKMAREVVEIARKARGHKGSSQ